MKKINQYKLLAGICALSLFTACDFEELNTNPFEMTDEMGIRDGVAVGGAVTAMQRAVVTVGTQADDTDAINIPFTWVPLCALPQTNLQPAFLKTRLQQPLPDQPAFLTVWDGEEGGTHENHFI